MKTYNELLKEIKRRIEDKYGSPGAVTAFANEIGKTRVYVSKMINGSFPLPHPKRAKTNIYQDIEKTLGFEKNYLRNSVLFLHDTKQVKKERLVGTGDGEDVYENLIFSVFDKIKIKYDFLTIQSKLKLISKLEDILEEDKEK